MPLYTFRCECGAEQDQLAEIADRDSLVIVCKCGKRMKRVPASPQLHGEGYQMKAILEDGSKVAGHFGKEAPRRRKK